jgi:hypothetical protein
VQVVNDVENYNHFSQSKLILFDPGNHINGILFDQSMNLLKTVEPLVDEEEQLIFELVSIFKNNNKGTKTIDTHVNIGHCWHCNQSRCSYAVLVNDKDRQMNNKQ